jgi:hypothetical protein
MLTPNSPVSKSLRDSDRGSFTGATSDSGLRKSETKIRLKKQLTNVSFNLIYLVYYLDA